jgi:phosphatidylglycerol:prolipoprotein diacylglycerol transferase
MNPQNYTTISFPFLGIAIDPARGFSIGPLHVNFYGLIIAIGMMLALTYAMRRRKEFGVREDDIIDGVLWIVPFAILCARLYYVAFSWDNYKDDLLSILYIWKGGLAIYGGVIGAVIGIFVFCKVKKLSPFAMLDMVALGFLIGQSIGRWGNFFNREAFGSPVSPDYIFSMGLFNKYTRTFEYYHPTFLYESVWNAVGFVLLHFVSKRRKYDGQLALGYCAWYGLGRALIEGLRMDSLYWGPFRVSQLLAAASCLAGVAVLLLLSFKSHDPANLFVNRVAAQESAQEDTKDE